MYKLPSTCLPVQAAVLDRLGDVLLADMVAGVQVGDGAGHLEDAVVGAGREAEPVGDHIRKRRMNLGLLQRKIK